MTWKIISSKAEPRFGRDGRPLKVVRSATARRMRLSVDPRDGTVRLSLPRRASLRAAYAWAEEQRGWIETQLERVPDAAPLGPGAMLTLGDETLRIEWRPDARRAAVRSGNALIVGGPAELVETRLLRWLKREALSVLEAETRALAARAGLTVGKIAIGDPRARWGSCSSRGDIRYSWRLILAPSFVRRATVAHEVAHLAHMNHGSGFRRYEAELLGADPTPARAWLRTHGAGLHRLGRPS